MRKSAGTGAKTCASGTSNMKTKKIFNNAKWIIGCKVVQSLLQLIVGMLSARYLGPSDYGLINYAASILSFMMPIMRLGLNETLVRELVEAPEAEGEIMGTALVMNIGSSLACMLAVFGIVSGINAGDTVTIVVCVLYSISLLFGAMEMIQYWFQFKLLAKYPSIAMVVSYIFVSAYKIFLLVTQKNVYWFAVSHSIEYGIVGLLLVGIFLKMGKRFRFSLSRAKKMLSVSKSYIWASMMVIVFQSTDHVMLTSFIGTAENGIYSAAVTCNTLAQFVFTAIIDSFRPVILSEKNEGNRDYEKNLSRLYCIVFYLSLAQSIVFTVFAGPIVQILYGKEYLAAVPVLRILTWYFVWSCFGSVRNIWILAEGKQKYLWLLNLSGAGANILMNAVLIPRFGAVGAAFASLMTQFATNFLFGYFIRPLRYNNTLLLRGINPRFLLREGREMWKQRREQQSDSEN